MLRFWMDGKIPVDVEEKDWEIVLEVVKRTGTHLPLSKGVEAAREIVEKVGCTFGRAANLVVVARDKIS